MRGIMKKSISYIIILLMMLSCVLGTPVTARADSLPVIPPNGFDSNRTNISHGTIHYFNYYSNATKSTRRAKIYLPPWVFHQQKVQCNVPASWNRRHGG